MSYWADLEADIVRAAVRSSSVTLIGDFNVNMDPAHPVPQHKHLTDLCAAFGLQNIVMQPTCETPQCPEGTMRDLILTNPALVPLATVVPTDISDHSCNSVTCCSHSYPLYPRPFGLSPTIPPI